MTAIGVLCARVRVEEKQIIAALAEAGVVAMPVPPASAPVPPGPASARTLGSSHIVADEALTALDCEVLIDRCQNRSVASAMLPVLKARGARVIDAGLAAAGTRLQIATALANAHLPRPATLLACSERAALEAADRLGLPATLLPLTPGAATSSLFDRDTAEAVIEHRVVLGGAPDALALVQAGLPGEHERGLIYVVDDQALAIDAADSFALQPADLALAVHAARALGAAMIGVEVVHTARGPVVWDVQPAGEMRRARQLGATSVAQAIAALVASAAASTAGVNGAVNAVTHVEWKEVHGGDANVALSA